MTPVPARAAQSVPRRHGRRPDLGRGGLANLSLEIRPRWREEERITGKIQLIPISHIGLNRFAVESVVLAFSVKSTFPSPVTSLAQSSHSYRARVPHERRDPGFGHRSGFTKNLSYQFVSNLKIL